MSKRQSSTDETLKTQDVIRLKPYEYIHVLDNNKNVSRVEVGPLTFTRQEHEHILQMPKSCINIPPVHYCVINNPVQRTKSGNIVFNKEGQVKVRLGDTEIRFEQEPFPLFPLEELAEPGVRPLEYVPFNHALKISILRDFDNRVAGDSYLVEGPCTYYPRVEEKIDAHITATIILQGEALRLKAKNEHIDRNGQQRKAGEEWLHEQSGAFLPHVDEIIVEKVQPITLTPEVGLHLEAICDFKDRFGNKRKAGQRWLVTTEVTDQYLPTPNETVILKVPITIISKNQFACVLNVCGSDGNAQLGKREVRVGHCTFFLKPGEVLENGIESSYILQENEAVLLQALNEHLSEEIQKTVSPGDKWMVHGPRTFVPNIYVVVLEKRQSIPLGENEGIYVRNQLTGKVRVVIGHTYMLNTEEELWGKELPPIVELMLQRQTSGTAQTKKRDKTRLVSYKIPHNALAQVYDFQTRNQRMVFGPNLVQLNPNEEFTIVSLSGSEWLADRPTEVTPKTPGRIKALYIFLGPDTLSDVMEVETEDHARLKLQLSFSWFFDVPKNNEEAARKVFNVPDFVADACQCISSRVRGAVASVSFDMFHKNSARIIATAVFGIKNEQGDPNDKLFFSTNLFTITSIDIQNVECVDVHTRESLQKSVKLAIEITTASQEAHARHLAEEREQTAKGNLERQLLHDKSNAEKERKTLLELQALSAAIQSTGASKAEAKANAQRLIIEGETEVLVAKLQAEAKKISLETELRVEEKKRDSELQYKTQLYTLEIAKKEEMAKIEVNKFKESVGAVGTNVIAAMARAGPEMQAKLLKGLGLQGYMLTDGNSPINLFNAAASLTGNVA